MPAIPPVQVALTGDDAALEAALVKAETRIGQTGTKLETMAGAAAVGERGLGRLERNLSSIVIATTGADPHLGHLAATIGSLSVDGPIMIGALAGLGAIGLLWEMIGGKAHEAAEEQRKAIAESVKAGEIRELGGYIRSHMGPAITDRAALAARRDELQASLDRGEIEPERIDVVKKAIADLNTQISDSTGAIENWGKELEEKGQGAADSARVLADTLEDLHRRAALLTPTTEQLFAVIEKHIQNVLMEGTADIEGSDPFAKARAKRLADRITADRAAARGELSADWTKRPIRGFDSALRPTGLIVGVHGPVEAAAGDFSRAGQLAVASLGRMAEAAITGSSQMEAAIVGALQSIIASTKFGASPWGALLGAGIGIFGALVSHKSSSDKTAVHIASVSPEAARAMSDAGSQRPLNVTVVNNTGGGSIERTEYELRRRQRRDAVERYTYSTPRG